MPNGHDVQIIYNGGKYLSGRDISSGNVVEISGKSPAPFGETKKGNRYLAESMES